MRQRIRKNHPTYRVLVVEDDPAVSAMLGTAFSWDGIVTSSALDASSAMAALRSQEFDAAIVDVMLPGRDGFSVVEEIRATSETRQIPIVMLTARSDDRSTWLGWKAGCDYYLTKPFDPDQLVATVHRLIVDAGAHGAAR